MLNVVFRLRNVRNVVSLGFRTTRTYCNLKIYCTDLRNGKDGRIKERIEKPPPPPPLLHEWNNQPPARKPFHRCAFVLFISPTVHTIFYSFYNSPYDFIMKYIFILHNGVTKHRGL